MEQPQPQVNISEPRQKQQPLSRSMQQNCSVGPRSQRAQSSLTGSDQPPSLQKYRYTLDRRADGSGYYEQQVFYATERDFDAKGKSYGTLQLVPLRYGVVPVRIPKTREPGHTMAYNIPFTVRRRKDSNKNGRYNVSLYDHRAPAGPERLMRDYDHDSQVADKVDQYEGFRVDYSKKHWGYKPCITACLPSCAFCPGLGGIDDIDEGDCFADVDLQQDRKRTLHQNSSDELSSRRQFLTAVKQAVMASARKEVVVFIHGYNVSNEGALRSAGQFVFDTAQDYSGIDYPGKFIYKSNQRVAVAFDWSSHSRPYSYGFVPCIQDDRDRAAEAGPKLAHLLLDLASELSKPGSDGSSSCNGIHVLAHSMGNYVLHYAMQHLSSVCKHTAVPIKCTPAAAATATATSATAVASAASSSLRYLLSEEEASGHSAVLSGVPVPGPDVAATPTAYEVAEAQAVAAASAGSGSQVPLAAAATAMDEVIWTDLTAPVSDGRNDLEQSDQLYQPPQQTDKGLDRPQLSAAVAAIAAATAASAAGTPTRPATPAEGTGTRVDIAVSAEPAAASGTSEDPESIRALLSHSSAGAAQETAVTGDATAVAAAGNAAIGAGYASGGVPSTTALAADETAAVSVPAPSTGVPAATVSAAPATANGLAAASGVDPDKMARRLAFSQSIPSPFVHSRHNHEDDCHGSPRAPVDMAGSGSGPAGRSSTVRGKVAKIDPGALIRHSSAGKLFSILKTVIHAAADVSRDDMIDTILTVRAGAKIHGMKPPQVTHYSSRRDQALCVSSFLRMIGKRKDGRAGFFMRLPSWREGHLFHPFLFRDVICVDATGFSKDPWGHGYFRDHRQVLTDIALALEGHTKPPYRSTITDSKDGEEWKCQQCNGQVAPDPKVVMYRVMTVEQQHNQQLQQCRQQLNKITRRLEALQNTTDLDSWKKVTQEMELQEQQVSWSVQQEQLLDAISTVGQLEQRPKGLLSMLKSYFV